MFELPKVMHLFMHLASQVDPFYPEQWLRTTAPDSPFTVFQKISQPNCEYVELRDASVSHFHRTPGFFWFLTPGVVRLGGLGLHSSIALVHEFLVTPGYPVIVPGYGVHSVRPVSSAPTKFLIINAVTATSDGGRPRPDGRYPQDTIFPHDTKIIGGDDRVD